MTVLRRLLGPLTGRPPWERERRAGERYLVLVRHGRASGGYGDALDPGLDEVGRALAEAMAADLAPTGPLPLVVSPMRRTRETVAPLEARWSTSARVEPGVGEIVAPSDEPEARAAWLRRALAGRWADLPADHQAWRRRVLDALLAIESDAVVVTHFVAINVAVGEATGDDRVVCFSPGHCSQTLLRVHDGRFDVMRLGTEAATEVR